MKKLLTLLSLGLEFKKDEDIDLSSFNDIPYEGWKVIRTMADEQGVSAIVLDGLSLMVNKYGRDKVASSVDFLTWQRFVLDWAGVMAQIEQRNARQKDVMVDMASRWHEKGCRVMVFKGQACATMYPRTEHRNPGDIDCYLMSGSCSKDQQAEAYKRGNDIAREVGATVDEGWYKHSVIAYRGESFENHQYFVHTREGKRSKSLQKKLEAALEVNEWETLSQSNILSPPVQWNAMFLTYHACAHFLSEGLRMKQVLDWAMFLQKYQEEVDWEAFYDYCERYHLRRFAEAITTICVNYLGVKISNNKIVAHSNYAEKILISILYDDDYVFSSGESGWRNRWHLVKNLFRYRLKYEEIYQESIWKQLWYYCSGYLLHTE